VSVTSGLSWLFLDRNAIRRSLILGGIIALFESGILLAAAIVDENFWLPGRGIGLLQHPGIPAIILADFIVLGLAAMIARKFMRLVTKLPVNSQASNRRYLRRAVTRGRAAILLNGRALRLFLLCAGFALLFWIGNAIQTLNPVRFYGNDVFDSYYHTASYTAFRIVLGISWILVYPYCVVVIFAVAGNIYLVTRTLQRHKRLFYSTFHPDRSGGFSFVGDINFLVIMMMLSLYVALITVIHTHQKLNILQISGFVILSVSFLILTFLISWPTISFLIKKRRSMMLGGYKTAHSSSTQSILYLIWLSTIASFSPYSSYQRVMINGSRLIPITIAALRLMGAI
jgi:hypothetical protein